MQLRKRILSLSIVAALGVAGTASAQEAASATQAAPADQTADEATDLDTVVVRGIRGAIQQ
jgi:iron complex outermembrane receptor protein